MDIKDKKKILDKIEAFNPIVLEIGCGNRKRIENAIAIDVQDYECVDIVGDVYDVLKNFPNNSVESVYSFHFIEHITDLRLLMEELSRILKKGGLIEFVAPHFSNPYYYSDYSHNLFFGLYTFCYFSSNSLFKRKVPSYQINYQFQLIKVDLAFKSDRRFYFRYLIKYILGNLFNMNNYMKEFYEENLCYIFPCYEVKYKLIKL